MTDLQYSTFLASSEHLTTSAPTCVSAMTTLVADERGSNTISGAENRSIRCVERSPTQQWPQSPQHRPHDQSPNRPLWCSLVTRIVNMNSNEARCKGAQDAIDKERDGIMSRGTFDMDHPRELADLMADRTVNEAMVGRVFCILGKRNAEMTEEHQSWKARAVFQGNDIRTKSGVDAAQLFQEVANAPASFVASRCTLATAALRRLRVTFRDALQAFLQSRIDGKDRVQTYAELPKSWWPDTWFADGSKRSQPLFRRPAVRMLLCLYGHPESGSIWEKDLEQVSSVA